MPVSFELGPGDRRCTIRFSGQLTLDDAQASLDWQIASGAWERGALVDMSDTTGIAIHFQHVRGFAGYVTTRARNLPPRGPVAVVAPQEVMYGVMRMFQQWVEAMRPPWDIYIARTTSEAEEWLARFNP
jgi:hypothetical protein